MNRKLVLTAILFWIDSSCWAGREPEPWDALPQMQDVKFSNTAVGFQSVDNRYFVLDRVTHTFQEEEASSFSAHFPPTKSPSEISANRGVGSSVLLRSSDGQVFDTRNAYCSEGANLKHQLLLNGKPISDHVQPCQSVSALEKVGDQLWLGTRMDGEYGDYPAEGIVIQSLLNGELVKKLSYSDGLTGDLVRAIRFDPHTKNIWVATNQGFNEISRDFSVISKQHFYEGFDDKTGRASIFLSAELKTNDPLAELQRKLQVQDPKAFYLSIQHIPSELRRTYRLGESCHGRSLPCTVENAFAPEAFNVLVPFVLNAARSSDEHLSGLALWRLCEFNDPRVAAYLKEKETHGVLSHEKSLISMCLSKFDAFGLFDSGTAGSRAEDLIAQEKSALETLRRSPKNPYITDLVETVVRTAKALQDTGNKEGFELINQHFAGSVGSRNDAQLFDDLFGRFYIYNELAPTAPHRRSSM